MDAWGRRPRGDRAHEAGAAARSAGETGDTLARFQFATQGPDVRRIPLAAENALRVLSVGGEPPPAARVADGSSTSVRRVAAQVAPVAVQVRLRRELAPTAEQVHELRDWLRRHRPAAGTPRPERVAAPPPPPAPSPAPAVPPLEPALAAEQARGPLWPLLAVSLGLAAALVAAVIL